MNDAVIEIQDVSYAYDTEPVLEHVDLTVERGEFLAIIGPNGGGKTTLLRLIVGLLKPTHGRISVFGKPPGREPARIGYVPQHGNLAPGFPATVEQVVLMGLPHSRRHGPTFWSDERALAHEALNRTGVDALAGQPFAALSGGQRQRVLIARALITRPELVLLDEPLSNIDPYGRQCIVETLTALGADITIVMVSHDLGITASAVTAVAAVNRYLLFKRSPHPTQAMLELMYGVHDPNCPVRTQMAHLTTEDAPKDAERP